MTACRSVLGFMSLLSMVASLATAQAQILALSVDDGAPVEINIGSPQNGSEIPPVQSFIGSYQGDEFIVSWNLRVTTYNPNTLEPTKISIGSNTSPNGTTPPTLIITNTSDQTHAYSAQFNLPTVTAYSDTAVSGSLSLKVEFSTDGGNASCASQWFPQPFHSVSNEFDDMVGVAYCPFMLSSSGAGTMFTTWAIPSKILGGSLLSQVSLNTRIQLTAYETAIFSSGLNISGMALCPGDQNGDFLVNANDLGVVLGHWDSNNLLADLDGDGVVGAGDLVILLSSYGSCAVTMPQDSPQASDQTAIRPSGPPISCAQCTTRYRSVVKRCEGRALNARHSPRTNSNSTQRGHHKRSKDLKRLRSCLTRATQH